MAAINKIWLQIGQSWANGQGGGLADLQSGYSGQLFNVRVIGDTKFACINSATNNNQYPTTSESGGCSIEFYFKDIAELLEEDIYLVKLAQGSTGLAYNPTWTDWSPSSTGELFDKTIAAIQRAKNWMNERGKAYSFEGIAWYQSEEDSKTLVNANAYEQNLIDFMALIVAETGNSNIKIYNQGLVLPPSGNRPYLAEINTAKTNFTNLDLTNRRMFTPIVTDWNPDNIHPNMVGYKKIWDDHQKPLIIADL